MSQNRGLFFDQDQTGLTVFALIYNRRF